jgi:hypothetical protein
MFGAFCAYKPHRLLHQLAISLAHTPRAILKPNAKMPSARNDRRNEWADVDTEASYHPRRAGIDLV